MFGLAIGQGRSAVSNFKAVRKFAQGGCACGQGQGAGLVEFRSAI